MTTPSTTTRRPRTIRRLTVTWLVILLGIYGAWLALLYVMQDSMLFPRGMAGPPAPAAPRGIESLWIETDAGRVEAWFWPAEGASPEAPAPLLVFFHGNGELMDGCLDVANEWRTRGYSVLLPEYRGYGRSAGRPSERVIVADALRFVGIAIERPDVAGMALFHGRSLGGGVAAQVAAALPPGQRPRAVIVQSAFTSVSSFAAGMLAPPILVKNPFHTDRALAEYAGPVLILHGAQDEIVSVAHGRRLHERIKGSIYAELPGRHNDFPLDEAAYWRAIDGFLAGLPDR